MTVYMKFGSFFFMLIVVVFVLAGCEASEESEGETLSSSKSITAFSFEASNSSALSTDIIGSIDETNHAISLNVPFGTNVSTLVATFTTSEDSVQVSSVDQVSGTTANDFSNSVTYTVVASDKTTQKYTVSVIVAKNSEKAITAFTFTTTANSSELNSDVTATIDETNHTISATVPFGTDITTLVATFTSSTDSTVSVGSITQTSGITANDFTSSVTYRVTAADAATQNYNVNISVATSSEKALTTFSFTSTANGTLASDVNGTINESNHTIAVTVPYNTSVIALIATYATSGSSVSVGGTAQTSGTTTNNFTSAVSYSVTAADASEQVYTVTVTVAAASSVKALNTFSINNIAGTINEAGYTISVTVPFGTTLTNLVANFTSSDYSAVSISGTSQVSGTTANDFSSTETYTVTAQDTSTQDYIVTVVVGPASSEKAITAFSFIAANNGALNGDNTATIDETNHTVNATVPFGTNVSALVATFILSDHSSVNVSGTPQVSGTTSNNFSSAVTYTVSAQDSSSQAYTVTVTIVANNAKAITAFSFTAASNGVLSASMHEISAGGVLIWAET